jgi:hypothetical protein
MLAATMFAHESAAFGGIKRRLPTTYQGETVLAAISLPPATTSPTTEPMVSATSSRQASVNAGRSAWLTPHRSQGTRIFQDRPASRT